MELYLFSNIPAVVQSLQKYCFQTESSQITHFSSFDTRLLAPEVLIILEPFLIKNIYFTISPIWKRYFSIHAPETKLVVMGVCEFQSANYIDILNFPPKITSFLENALLVTADWEVPIDGANLLQWIHRFYQGHGRSSLMAKLNALIQSMEIATQKWRDGTYSLAEINNNLLLPYAIPEWQEVTILWQYYLPYFQYLPFYPTIQEIQGIFSDLSENFTCFLQKDNILLETEIDVKLTQVSQKLAEIERSYIGNRL